MGHGCVPLPAFEFDDANRTAMDEYTSFAPAVAPVVNGSYGVVGFHGEWEGVKFMGVSLESLRVIGSHYFDLKMVYSGYADWYK